MNQEFHIPVLINEVIDNLLVKENKWYVDATAGGGGHTKKILEKKGRVLAIDCDNEAITYLKERFKTELLTKQIRIKEGNFADLKNIITGEKIETISGILFDLGMSSYQIKNSGRGFSFGKDEIIDMRMSKENPLSAEKIINNYSQKELYEIFRFFGEENLAGELAEAICVARTINPIQKTSELVNIAKNIYRKAKIFEKINPATKMFQAIRIAVNSELVNLKLGLEQGFELIDKSGRLAVISFHSLEDRIVKQFFLEKVNKKQGIIINKKPMIAQKSELDKNKAARSAKLRVIEKI